MSRASTPLAAVFALLKASVLIVTNLTLTQAWFPQLFDYWNDGGSWSISAEAFFYLLFPVLIVLIAKLSRWHLVAAWFVFYIFSVLPALSYAVFENRPSPSVSIFYAMPVFRIPEFLCGICICLALTKFRLKLKYPFAIFMSAILALVGCLSAIGSVPVYTVYNFVAVPVISVAILTLTQGVPFFGKILGSELFRWLGRISYCFYSFQALVILSVASFHDEIIRAVPFLTSNILFAVFDLVCLLVLAAAGYHLIEEPARKHIRSLHSNRLSSTTKEAEQIATGP